MNDFFLKELEKLNTAQAEAVNHTEGPVLVIAGPGTGKTQILAARIGNILSSADIQCEPHNILCLTYTDAGTVAMRKRLLKFIGPMAYRVHINTFHSFCNSVIQENLDIFGMRSLQAISDLEKMEVIHKIIDDFPKNHPLKRYTGEAYYETSALNNLYQVMKKENWTSDYISRKIDEYLNDLPLRDEYIYKRNGPNFKKGDVKTAQIAAEELKMRKLRAAAETFDSYQNALTKNQRYDYDDMLIWVLRAFNDHPDLLRRYQEQFLYFLVDEYQDTNGSQNELLKRLVEFWDSPNVFVVGDDDQSIYRFQGASVENIREFADSYLDKDLKIVMMTENYRSSQVILDTSKALIDQNKGRLVNILPNLSKNLVAKNKEFADLALPPQLRAYFNSNHETVAITNEIESLRASGVGLNEIAVIYRNHAQAEDMARFLESRKVPLNIKRRADVLKHPIIEKIITILKYIDREAAAPHSAEDLLFTIMHFDFFDIPALDIAKFGVEMGRKKMKWRECLKELKPQTQQDLFSNRTSAALAMKRLSDDIEQWIHESFNVTLQQLLEKILTGGGILSYILLSGEKMWLMQHIQTFFNYLKEESAKNPKINIHAFLNNIQLMEDNSIAMPIDKISHQPEGVNFLTAHSSKGLEFEYVFMIGCDSKTWDKAGNSRTYSFPDTMLTKFSEDETEESRRLFYVSMTRAKKQLTISYGERNKDDKELEKSRFVAEIESTCGLPVVQLSVPDEALLGFNIQLMKEVEKPQLELIDHQYLDSLLENYALSVTHLNNYLHCPVSFYFNNLVRVPAAKNESMAFGSAVHHALEMLFRKMLESPEKKFPTHSDLVKDFEWFMNHNRDSFTEAAFKRRIEYGNEILPAFYRKNLPSWELNKEVNAERNFANVEFEGIPMKGKIDKMEFNGNNANVIDYKTGKYKNAKPKFKKPAENPDTAKAKFEDLKGGDYWRQAVFYKILIDNDHSNKWVVDSTQFDFVEPDKDTGEYYTEKIFITPEDQEIVKGQIRDTYTRIKNKEFTKGCGEEDCQWCNFVKHYLRGEKVFNESLLEMEDDARE